MFRQTRCNSRKSVGLNHDIGINEHQYLAGCGFGGEVSCGGGARIAMSRQDQYSFGHCDLAAFVGRTVVNHDHLERSVT